MLQGFDDLQMSITEWICSKNQILRLGYTGIQEYIIYSKFDSKFREIVVSLSVTPEIL